MYSHVINSHARRYSYCQLPHEDSIRLLHLYPGVEADPLECDVVLERLGDRPSYKAISYVWGDSTVEDVLTCGSGIIPLTGNLSKALRRARSTANVRVFWADAASIDQQNLDERGHQVRLMGNIFSTSKEVLIHLDSSLSEQDMHVMQRLHLIDTSGPLPPIVREMSTRLVWNAFWDAPWFKRAWTVQEVGLAKKATIVSEECELDWRRLMRLCIYLNGSGSTGLSFFRSSQTRALWVGYEINSRLRYSTRLRSLPDRLLFLYCLHHACCDREATDARDLVYAFLAHPHAPILVPDYRKSMSKINLDLATQWISTTRNAEILHFACKHHVSEADTSLPSWCPSWELTKHAPHTLVVVSQRSRFSPSGETTDFTVHLKGGELMLNALVFDTITKCAAQIRRDDLGMTPWSPGSRLSAIIQLALEESRGGSYSAPYAALWRTFSAGYWNADDEESQYHLEQLTGRSIRFLTSPSSNEAGPAKTTPKDSWHYPDGMKDWHLRSAGLLWGRRFFVTEGGRFGIAPPSVQENDLCCVVKGLRTPFILRKSGTGNNRYEVVGEAYIDGVMFGELMEGRKGNEGFEDIVLV